MSKPAPLMFPKKGEATPPADAIGRSADSTPAPIAPPAEPEPRRRPNRQAPGRPGQAALNEAAAATAGLDLAGLLEGGDDLVQINVTVPRRIRNQLHLLKLTGQAGSIKAVTTEAVTKAVEQLVAGKGGK